MLGGVCPDAHLPDVLGPALTHIRPPGGLGRQHHFGRANPGRDERTEAVSGVVRGIVVHVHHRRVDVRVAHLGFDVGQGEHLDRERAEGVAESW
jgi:hypothetical protein